ncbi:MAG: CDP-diacylglycerol O-phosphatidyltransferase [Deltaproteobacteria bacterium]|nr:CDP-diacylglycerol O-phosphatidyltransferase [Deltaproteobacteria bacterium]MBW2396037.1 CDP-diacylglycerol O-phosphatidyltransferase [Deltaproteobacteria bacterium]
MGDELEQRGSRSLAWAVHAFTASGAVAALLAVLAAARGDFQASALWMLVSLSIDAVDGSLARKVGVSVWLPDFDGRRLDDIVDFLGYVFVPALFLVWTDSIPHWGFAALPILASAYGFSQGDAKSDDHFFVGFPSYWNVVAIYAWALPISQAVTVGWLIFLSIAVFVPLKYLYPSHMRYLFWTTNLGAGAWTCVVAAGIAWPEKLAHLHLIELSLLYPAYYIAVSLWLGGMQRRARGKA